MKEGWWWWRGRLLEESAGFNEKGEKQKKENRHVGGMFTVIYM